MFHCQRVCVCVSVIESSSFYFIIIFPVAYLIVLNGEKTFHHFHFHITASHYPTQKLKTLLLSSRVLKVRGEKVNGYFYYT